MEGCSVVQEDPPDSLSSHHVDERNEPIDVQWQDLTEKASATQNSRLLFLTVEYVPDIGENIEYNNISSSASDGGRISPFDSGLCSEKYSSLFNTLVIPTNGEPQYPNSVVVLPSTRNCSHPISIVVNPSEIEKHLRLEEFKNLQNENVSDNLKLESGNSQIIITSGSNSETPALPKTSGKNCSSKVVLSENLVQVSLSHNTDTLGAESTISEGEENKMDTPINFVSSCDQAIHTGFLSPLPNAEPVILNGAEEKNKKDLLDPSQFVISSANLKQDDLLLPGADQNNDLLLKSESLIGTESYSLVQESYIQPQNENSYSNVKQHLSVNNTVKENNEYLLPDAITFEDADSSILQSPLEVLSSEMLDGNDLLLYDKSRLRQSKRHPAEHLGFEYWCEDCEFGLKCGQHEVKIISDKPVLSRARATLPKELLAINKLHGKANGEGVFARKTIMRRVQFGPVEGQLLHEWDKINEIDADNINLFLETETGHLLKMDVSDENESNWMRFVRKAVSSKEQNLILTQQGKSLYYITTRVIPPRQELKVGYSPQYAMRRKLPVLENFLWTCFECADNFSTSIDLHKHLNLHENKKEWNENLIKNKSKIASVNGISNLIKKTERQISGSKNREAKESKCWNCHKVFPRNYSLKRHLMLVHSEKDKNKSECFKNVKNKGAKPEVANTLFKKKNSNGSGSEWLCTHCNLTFDNPSVLNLHTLTHAAEDLESEPVLGLPSELSSVYHEGEFLVESGDVQCPQCTQEFPSKRELIDHVSTHGKMNLKKTSSNPCKPFKCDQCYKSFGSEIRLQKHMLVHGSEDTKPYQCGICSKRFLNNSALSCHLKTHNDKKFFECPLCKKEFEQVFALKEHVKTHAADGCYTCPHCSKVFDGYSAIKKHVRAFHSIHQHICKDCGKLCPTLDKLRMHSLKHSDHREFLCANCGKQFKRKDKLKEHMKRMHSAEREMKLLSLALKVPSTKDRRFVPKMSPLAYDRFVYKCRSCLVGFKRRGMLVNHLAKRHPDVVPATVPELNLPILKATRDYFCQYCDKIYKSSSKRKSHILKNHPGAELPMSNRQKGGIPHVPGMPNPTFSKTVGSVKTTPHGCKWCHKQYASKAKLLQHQRKKHSSLLPQSQQIPKSSKSPSSPVGGKTSPDPLSPSEMWTKPSESLCFKPNEKEINQIDRDACSGVLGQHVSTSPKKIVKGLQENVPCELLHQAMTELSRSLSEYKLPFSGSQENLLKMMGLKDGAEGTGREDEVASAPIARPWPEIPPYPPR